MMSDHLPKIVPIVAAMLRPIAPPDSESKLALRAQAHALVPEAKVSNQRGLGDGNKRENVEEIVCKL